MQINYVESLILLVVIATTFTYLSFSVTYANLLFTDRLLMKGSSLVNGEESPQEVDQDSFASPRPLKYKLEKKVEKLEQKLAEKKDQLANNIHEVCS